MTESLSMTAIVMILVFAVALFVVPSSKTAVRCLGGVGLGLGGLAFLSGNPLAGTLWSGAALLFFSVPKALRNFPSSAEPWQNWFWIVVSVCSLWLLSLFLLWTFQQALSPESNEIGASNASHSLDWVWANLLWVEILLVPFVLGLPFGMGTFSRPPAAAEEPT